MIDDVREELEKLDLRKRKYIRIKPVNDVLLENQILSRKRRIKGEDKVRRDQVLWRFRWILKTHSKIGLIFSDDMRRLNKVIIATILWRVKSIVLSIYRVETVPTKVMVGLNPVSGTAALTAQKDTITL